MYPWLLWFMWKNRNGLFFEEKIFLASEVVSKACEESNLGFYVQSTQKDVELKENPEKVSVKKKWKLPPYPWLKCNIGASW